MDERNQIKTDCQYDLIGRVVGTDSSDGLTLRNQYDDKNRVKAVTQKINDSLLTTEFLYGDPAKSQKPGLFYGLKVDGEERASYSYDELARQTEKTVQYGNGAADHFATVYSYQDGPVEGTTTTLLSELHNGADILSYTYDANGNIETISENGVEKCKYHYNELNSLIREDNVWENKTICYAYDQGGNLTSRKEYAYTEAEVPAESTLTGQKDYTYRSDGWKDQLISYNGQAITYDAIGNPLTYRGMNFTWELGRQLKKVRKDGADIMFAYDSSGNRIKKTAGGVETRYFLSGGQIIALKKGNELIHFIYDEKGNPFALKVNNETYYYIYNGQNDVIGLIDSEGEQVVTYRYNSWGLPLGIEDNSNIGIGTKNPFRYRGYCYDGETGLYYLKSRYYDPEVGRFINADGFVSTGTGLLGHNMYAYCNDNPIKYKDSEGNCITNARGDTIHYNCKYSTSITTTVNNMRIANNFVHVVLKGVYSATYNAVNSSKNSPNKPSNMGKGTYEKLLDTELQRIKRTSQKADDFFNKTGRKLDYLGFCLEVGDAVCEDFNSGQSKGKIAWDVGVDVVLLTMNECASDMAGALIGVATVAVFGTGAGALAIGLAAGFLVDNWLERLNETGREELKGW